MHHFTVQSDANHIATQVILHHKVTQITAQLKSFRSIK